jgi:hypothetical protein
MGLILVSLFLDYFFLEWRGCCEFGFDGWVGYFGFGDGEGS